MKGKMLAKVYSVASFGLDSIKIEVEAEVIDRGFPSFNIVGLASKAVDEARERVRVAINNSGLNFPSRSKITINLAPADVVKEGSCYDLPIALSILLASGQLNLEKKFLEQSLFFGELSLDGSLRHTKGVFLVADAASKNGFARIFVPRLSAAEAACFRKLDVFPVDTLSKTTAYFLGLKKIKPLAKVDLRSLISGSISEFNMSQIIGQFQAKRALEIAAAGGHNVFMSGSPGSGKTMLARAMPGIVPPLSSEEAIEVTRIYSATGNIDPGESLVRKRPFRSPHHTISRVGMVGGGSKIKPGEVSLAHRGVLFLDEFGEFPRSVLEALRQPLEDGCVNISRASGSVSFPSKFLLVAASNPCPCGYLNHPTTSCRCLPGQIANYRKRLSGPIMDRIDIHLVVPPVKIRKLSDSLRAIDKNLSEDSVKIRERTKKARKVQRARFKKLDLSLQSNSEMKTSQVKEICRLKTESAKLLNEAAEKLSFSARAYFKIIKISRTIADFNQEDEILPPSIAEALQYQTGRY